MKDTPSTIKCVIYLINIYKVICKFSAFDISALLSARINEIPDDFLNYAFIHINSQVSSQRSS